MERRGLWSRTPIDVSVPGWRSLFPISCWPARTCPGIWSADPPVELGGDLLSVHVGDAGVEGVDLFHDPVIVVIQLLSVMVSNSCFVMAFSFVSNPKQA